MSESRLQRNGIEAKAGIVSKTGMSSHSSSLSSQILDWFYWGFGWVNTVRLNFIRIGRWISGLSAPVLSTFSIVVLPIITLSMYGVRFLSDLGVVCKEIFKARSFKAGFRKAMTDARQARMLNDAYWIGITAIATYIIPMFFAVAIVAIPYVVAGAYVLDWLQDYYFKDKTILKDKKAELESVKTEYQQHQTKLQDCKDETEKSKINLRMTKLGVIQVALEEEIAERQKRRNITNAINVGLFVGMALLCVPGAQLLGAAVVLTFGVAGLAFRVWDQIVSKVKSAPSIATLTQSEKEEDKLAKTDEPTFSYRQKSKPIRIPKPHSAEVLSVSPSPISSASRTMSASASRASYLLGAENAAQPNVLSRVSIFKSQTYVPSTRLTDGPSTGLTEERKVRDRTMSC